jgi:hypothetical protein
MLLFSFPALNPKAYDEKFTPFQKNRDFSDCVDRVLGWIWECKFWTSSW